MKNEVISLTEDEGFKKGFKGEQGKPLIDMKNCSGVKEAMERQEVDGDRTEGRQQSKVKVLRRAWGTGRGERRNKNRKAGEGK